MATPEERPRSGTEVVLLHGVNNTPEMWVPVQQHLTGFPSSAPPLPALEDVDAIADELLRELPEQFVVVGHSFGGYVALEILRQASERVAAIVLVNSSDGADSPEAGQRRERAAARAAEGGYGELATAATAVSYHPNSLVDERLMADRVTAIAAYGAPSFIAHQHAAARRRDQRETLRRARVPTLVVAASDDRVILTETQRTMADAVAADFVLVDGAGHMLPAEQPERLAGVLQNWLRTAM